MPREAAGGRAGGEEDEVRRRHHQDLARRSEDHVDCALQPDVYLQWKGHRCGPGRTGYADYSLLPKADVILVTHPGPDHLDPATVKSLSKDKTALMVCPHCSLYLPTGTIMINGETQTVDGLKIEAVPAYNIKGKGGNGKPNTTRELRMAT